MLNFIKNALFWTETKYMVFFVLFIISCSINTTRNNDSLDQSEAIEVINKMDSLLKTENYEEALKLFHPSIFRNKNKENLLTYLKSNKTKYGTSLKYKIIKRETYVREGDSPDSDYKFIIEHSFNNQIKRSVLNEINLTKDNSGNLLIYSYHFITD